MKTKVTKRLISAFLCVAMLFTYLQLTVFAADGEPMTYTVSFDANGGAAIDPITVIYGEKYGKLPSTSITGLSGGDSNWYLVDENGDVTATKITSSTTVSSMRNHTLFAVRKVLAPTVKLTLTVPGGISDSYQYYIPENSTRVLTATINNQNDEILNYAYAWYKDGVLLENETASVLTLEGKVSDAGTYKVAVTATLKENANIVVTSDAASAEKEQQVKIMRLSNTLAFDANGGEGGPSGTYTNGTTITVGASESTRSGYIFDGWNTAADGSGDSYKAGDTVTFTEDSGNGGCTVTLYAQWIKAYGIYVGGVQILETNKDDLFGDGKVSYDAETDILTLNGYNYEAEGYRYRNGEDGDVYSAAIYSEGSLTIKLEGNNTVKNTFTDASKEQYGDGVIAEGSLSFIGDGKVDLFGSFAVGCNEQATIDGGILILNATDNGIVTRDIIIKNNADVQITTDRDGIRAIGGSVTVEDNASLTIDASHDGIDADKDVTITDSTVDIDAEGNGIYAYDGGVFIGSTKVSLYEYRPAIVGTKVSIQAGGDYGIFAYTELTIDEKLTISAPEGGSIGELSESDSTYNTVVLEGAPAKDITIEPLGYTVTIEGLSYGMGALVPAGWSLNEAYCERYKVEDFSEILKTQKDGYIFGGWYTDATCTDGNEYDFDSAVNADRTIYAKWSRVYVPTVKGGETTINPESATAGETVVITPKPQDGKQVDAVTVTDKDGNAVAVTKNADGTYSFIQPESEVTVEVTYKDIPIETPDQDNETGDQPNDTPADKDASETGDNDTPTDKDDSGVSDHKPADAPNKSDASDHADNPKTGDNSNLWLLFALLFVSGGCLFGVTLDERKRRTATKR